MNEEERMTLRARDFWGSIALIAGALFFILRSSKIPLFATSSGGVSGIDWYDSAAIVPLGIFTSLFLLGILLLVISIRSGGASQALSAAGIGWDRREALRFVTIMAALGFYIFGLVPRVDFIICSALLLSALIWGHHDGRAGRMVLTTGLVAFAGAYALVVNLPQARWNALGDDWVTLCVWLALTALMLVLDGRTRLTRFVPVISVIVPLILVCVMAFGFRQNVPMRGGLLFKQIEYHYYVNLRPLWSR